MKKEQSVMAQVTETLAGARFKVVLESDQREIIAYLAGKLKLRHIKISVGDRVEVILDPAGGKASNRIIWRH